MNGWVPKCAPRFANVTNLHAWIWAMPSSEHSISMHLIVFPTSTKSCPYIKACQEIRNKHWVWEATPPKCSHSSRHCIKPSKPNTGHCCLHAGTSSSCSSILDANCWLYNHIIFAEEASMTMYNAKNFKNVPQLLVTFHVIKLQGLKLFQVLMWQTNELEYAMVTPVGNKHRGC